MSCCGASRQRASTGTMGTGGAGRSRPAPEMARAGAVESRHRPVVRPLEYVGTTGLTVLGPATGRRYRFAAPGARVAVDPRDWAALARLTQLRPS